MNIVLFGIKGCGKTTFARKIAEKLKRAFIDTDALIEELYLVHRGKKMSCRNIFLEVGSARFRTLEYEVIQSLQDVQHSVIAVGGGTMTSIENVEALMKTGTLFYLVCEKEVLKKRVFSQEIFPAFLDPNDPEGSFDRMHDQRAEFYHKLGSKEIDVTHMKEKEVITTICKMFDEGVNKGKKIGK